MDKKFLRIGYRLFNLLFSLRAFLSSIQHIRHHISENGGQYQTDEPFIKICAAFKFCLTGLYLLTDERWILETVIQMRLQRTDKQQEDPEGSIPVLAKVVRCGVDGVGLQFVFSLPGSRRNAASIARTNLEDLARFLHGLAPGSGGS